jgi:transcriptional regulator with XRE-family HTH domain
MGQGRVAQQLGAKVRQARTQAGLTQREVGARVGVTKNHVTQIERGARLPSVEVLLKLAYLFEVSTDFLLKDELTEADRKAP